MWKLTKKYLKDIWVLLWSKTEVDEKAIATLKEVQKRYKLTAQEIEDVATAMKEVANQMQNVRQKPQSLAGAGATTDQSEAKVEDAIFDTMLKEGLDNIFK